MTSIIESIQTENVVASTEIGGEVDLEELSEKWEAADYDPEEFPGVVYRTQYPKAAALIFRSGNVVATGGKSIDEIQNSLHTIYNRLSELGIEIEEAPPITIQNLVASADLGRSLNLDLIAIGLGLEDVEYSPEDYPGLVYRIEDPEMIVLLFGSGKVVATGAKKSNDAQRGIEKFASKLDDLNLIGDNTEIPDESVTPPADQDSTEYDVFISHASEDKEDIVRPLAHELSEKGLNVWYDEFELSLGDSLRDSIDEGLTESNYGIVVLSEVFFEKKWTQYELNSLVSRHFEEDKVILPVWYDVDRSDIVEHSPMLADLLAVNVDEETISEVAEEIHDEIV